MSIFNTALQLKTLSVNPVIREMLMTSKVFVPLMFNRKIFQRSKTVKIAVKEKANWYEAREKKIPSQEFYLFEPCVLLTDKFDFISRSFGGTNSRLKTMKLYYSFKGFWNGFSFLSEDFLNSDQIVTCDAKIDDSDTIIERLKNFIVDCYSTMIEIPGGASDMAYIAYHYRVNGKWVPHIPIPEDISRQIESIALSPEVPFLRPMDLSQRLGITAEGFSPV